MIKAVTEEDFHSWNHLWQQYQQFYKIRIPEATTKTTWQRILNGHEGMFSALAWFQGEAVGLVNWVFHRSTWTTGDYCYLQDLIVAPHVRNKAIGRQLVQHVYSVAEKAKCTRVYWLTHKSNKAAIHLYKKIAEDSGFIQFRKNL